MRKTFQTNLHELLKILYVSLYKVVLHKVKLDAEMTYVIRNILIWNLYIDIQPQIIV
jgi:hypothetical protein